MPVGVGPSVDRRTVHPDLAQAIVGYVKRSSGGRFTRSLASAQCRGRSLTNYEYSLTGRYAVVGCNLQVPILC